MITATQYETDPYILTKKKLCMLETIASFGMSKLS